MRVYAGTVTTVRGESPAFVAAPTKEYAASRGLRNPHRHVHERECLMAMSWPRTVFVPSAAGEYERVAEWAD